MKQKVSVYAIIKQDGKILLLKRAQGRKEIIGKFELPGGPLPFDHAPYSAVVDSIRQQTGTEPATVQLYDVRGYISIYDPQLQRVDIVYLAVFSHISSIELSPRHGQYRWYSMQEIQQLDVTESSYNLLNIDTFEKEVSIDTEEANKNVVLTTAKNAIIYCDGGSRGNPGPSASGFVILDKNEQLIEEGGAYLGITTNNQAEYHAVRLALEAALKHNVNQIQFRLDSMLVVNQMTGIYKIKSRDLWPIHERIKELIHHFKQVTFMHVRREFNKEADAMVNKILDEHTGA